MALQTDLIPAIRKEFPRAETDASGRKRIFFDAGAGSLVLKRAADAEYQTMLNYSSNLGLPAWESQKAEEIILEARRGIRDFINAESEVCIVSGESATSLFFRLGYALSKTELKKDENIVTTEYEHYANASSLLELQRRGAVGEVRFARFDPETGMLDLDHLASLIDSKTRVVSASGVANGLGTKTPLAQVGRLAKKAGAYFMVDAVHMAPHMPVDVQQLDCDFLVFSGYKVFSRRGSFMYGKQDLLQRLSPYRVDPAPDRAPGKWEWGTLDQALFAAFSAVIEYLTWLGSASADQVSMTGQQEQQYQGRSRTLKSAMKWIETYEADLSRAALGGIDGLPGILQQSEIVLYGPRDLSRIHEERSPTFVFNLRKAGARKVAEYLWSKHAIAVLPEDYYSRALKTYDVPIAVRASLAHYNTLDEVRTLLTALEDCVQHFS